jgi:hypothetical protein
MSKMSSAFRNRLGCRELSERERLNFEYYVKAPAIIVKRVIEGIPFGIHIINVDPENDIYVGHAGVYDTADLDVVTVFGTFTVQFGPEQRAEPTTEEIIREFTKVISKEIQQRNAEFLKASLLEDSNELLRIITEKN